MLWYDVFNKKNSTLSNIYKSCKIRKQLSTNQITLHYFNKSQKNTLNYIIPFGWKCTILLNSKKNKYYIIIYSGVYQFTTPININNSIVNFDLITNQLWLKLPLINNFTLSYFKVLSFFYEILLKPTFTKLKFKGKGYYIYKNYRNTITPQFGYSHRLYLYAFHTNVLFLTKTSLVLFGLNKNNINYTVHKLLKWRPINIFTGRGIRLSKQVIYKKSGKVSTYR
jgi:hypothetical protein